MPGCDACPPTLDFQWLVQEQGSSAIKNQPPCRFSPLPFDEKVEPEKRLQEENMTGPKTNCRRGQLMAGLVLAGVGCLILGVNLDRMFAECCQVLGISHGATGEESLGILPAVLAVTHVLQAYATDHRRFLESVLQHFLASFWPLLLVIAGTVLWRESGDCNPLP